MQKFTDVVNSVLVRLFNAKQEAGQTLVEYGLIVALLSIAAIAALGILGTDIREVFEGVSEELDSAGT